MKGKILGFDGTNGAILGDDGKRYRLPGGEWKGQGQPNPQDEVDFVEEDGEAREVYVVRRAGLLSGGAGERGVQAIRDTFAQGTGSTATSDLVGKARANPQAVVAAVMLVVSLLFTYVSAGIGVQKVDTTVLTFSPDVGSWIDQLSSAIGGFGADTGMLDALSLFVALGYLFWLVPILAVLVVWKAWNGSRSRMAELGLGVFGIGSVLYYLLFKVAVASAMEDLAGPFGSSVGSGLSLGFGGWLLAACGVAMMAIMMGLVGKKAG